MYNKHMNNIQTVWYIKCIFIPSQIVVWLPEQWIPAVSVCRTQPLTVLEPCETINCLVSPHLAHWLTDHWFYRMDRGVSVITSLVITSTVLYLTGGSPLDDTMVHRLMEQYSLMTMAVVTLNNCCLACLNYITWSKSIVQIIVLVLLWFPVKWL